MKEQHVKACAIRVGADKAGGTVNLGMRQEGASEMLVLCLRWGEAMGLAHSVLEVAREVAGDSDSAVLNALQKRGPIQVETVGVRLRQDATAVEVGMEVEGRLAVTLLDAATARTMAATLAHAADVLEQRAAPGVQQ